MGGNGEFFGFEVMTGCRSFLRYHDGDKERYLELDMIIHSKKIAIEYCGLYYHEEKILDDTRPIPGKDFHLKKLQLTNNKGYNLIQIFEDEWILKEDIVKHRLLQILNKNDNIKIGARKCIIKEIDSKTKNEFLEKYHIQGKDSAIIKLGAFYGETLVSVMTFSKGSISKGSYHKEGEWELNRFCSNYDYHVIGIASKLLNYFKINYEWIKIFSYADRRWSIGDLYYQLGFNLEKITDQNYWYSKGIKRIHRFNLRKTEDDPKDKTEEMLRLEQGYNRIWDCGNLKFVLENN